MSKARGKGRHRANDKPQRPRSRSFADWPALPSTRLTKEEEADLIIKAQAGCRESKQRLVDSVSEFVMSLAHKFSARHQWIPVEDAYQQGMMAVSRVIDKFKLSEGTRLITPVRQSAVRSMISYKPNVNPIMRIPGEAIRWAFKVDGPSTKSYAAQARRAMSLKCIRLDPGVDIADDDGDDGRDHEMDRIVVGGMLDSLGDEDREMVEHLFGLGGRQQITMAEYGRLKRISKSQVDRKRNAVVAMLRTRFSMAG